MIKKQSNGNNFWAWDLEDIWICIEELNHDNQPTTALNIYAYKICSNYKRHLKHNHKMKQSQ